MLCLEVGGKEVLMAKAGAIAEFLKWAEVVWDDFW
jgi:hypothetical protein